MRFVLESCLCSECSAITGLICNEIHETCESEMKGWRGWWGRDCTIVSTFFPCPSRCNHPRDVFQCLSQSGCCQGGGGYRFNDCGRPDPLTIYQVNNKVSRNTRRQLILMLEGSQITCYVYEILCPFSLNSIFRIRFNLQ